VNVNLIKNDVIVTVIIIIITIIISFKNLSMIFNKHY